MVQWLLFLQRNPDFESKAGKKFATNREDHCHDDAFQKMYSQNQVGLVESGNAKEYEQPVHVDIEGNIVEDETDTVADRNVAGITAGLSADEAPPAWNLRETKERLALQVCSCKKSG